MNTRINMIGLLTFSLSLVLLININFINGFCLKSNGFKSVTILSKSKHNRFGTILHADRVNINQLGGKIVVSGIGDVDEDEFFLSLLNEQSVWDPVVLTTEDEASTRKRFLSRTARYSGLLNILNVVNTNITDLEQLKQVLGGATAWISFGVAREQIEPLSKVALESNVKRVIFTTILPSEKIAETELPEYSAVIKEFEKYPGASFTGIRHGEVIKGDEDNDYEIVNATVPCLESFIQRGVLARLTAELLQISKADNIECGVSSSSSFAGAYLNVLRSSGLTRRQEVEKVLAGGIQRVARLTVNEYENRIKRQEEAREKLEKRKVEQELELKLEHEKMMKLSTVVEASQSIDDKEGYEPETVEQMIKRRADEIIKNVWIEYDTRMYTKSSSKLEFYEANIEKARELAEKEVEEQLLLQKKKEEEESTRNEIMEKLVDVNRKQYSKLLALERKEMMNQKQLSDTWVKYVYLLLEYTLEQCQKKDILFYNWDEFGQTMLLRASANELRKLVNIPEYEIIYDPLDAAVIVEKLSDDENIGVKFGINKSGDDVVTLLNSKYASVLKSVSALRGASQIVDLAIETLNQELPPPPPTVSEARRLESLAKKEEISKARLESIRNRGQPSAEGESVVGKL